MPDDKDKRGKPDQDRVSQQPHEVDRLKHKYPDLTKEKIKEVIREEGPMRKPVEKELEKEQKREEKKK